MPATTVYYDLQKQEFVSEQDALELVRKEINEKGNLDVIDRRVYGYGHFPDELPRTKIMKFVIKVSHPV